MKRRSHDPLRKYIRAEKFECIEVPPSTFPSLFISRDDARYILYTCPSKLHHARASADISMSLGVFIYTCNQAEMCVVMAGKLLSLGAFLVREC